MRPNIISKPERKTLVLKKKKKSSIKRVFFFPPDGVMCLYMRLKPGHKTPKPPG